MVLIGHTNIIHTWNVYSAKDFVIKMQIDLTKLENYDEELYKDDFYEYVRECYGSDNEFIEECLENIKDRYFDIEYIDNDNQYEEYWYITEVEQPITLMEYQVVLNQLGKTREQIQKEIKLVEGI